MKPTPFQNPNSFLMEPRVYGSEQPEYQPLPTYVDVFTHQGGVLSCWSLSWWERLKLLVTGRVYVGILSFNDPLQPQILSTDVREIMDVIFYPTDEEAQQTDPAA